MQSARRSQTRSNIAASSLCSSEYNSRLEAIQIQLEEEKKRRMSVEATIRAMLVAQSTSEAIGWGAGAKHEVCELLTAHALAEHDKTHSTPSEAAAPNSVSHRIPQPPPLSTSKQPLTAAPANTKPTAPKEPQCTSVSRQSSSRDSKSRAANSISLRDTNIYREHFAAGGKPPLPKAARSSAGRSSSSHYHRKKVPSCELYVAGMRHQERLNRISAFALPPLNQYL